MDEDILSSRKRDTCAETSSDSTIAEIWKSLRIALPSNGARPTAARRPSADAKLPVSLSSDRNTLTPDDISGAAADMVFHFW